jgi:hypothetical protein
VFAVRRRGDDLFGVEFVRGAQDHGVDGVVGQHGVDVGIDVGERTGGRLTRAGVDVDARDDLHVFVSVEVADDLAAAPSQSNDGCIDHTEQSIAPHRVDALSADVNFAPVCVAIRECLPPSADVELTYQRRLREIGHDSGLRAHR